jgi:hypothetical protein
MKTDGRKGTIALTPEQALLVRAATGDEAAALDAWGQWKQRVDVQQADPASLRLLPLLYRNLSRCAANDPVLQLCRGVYRKTWYENHVLLQRLESVLAALRAAGIATLLPGDPSLLLVTHRDIGSRPLDALGVLVRPEQAARAGEVLAAAGWRSGQPPASKAAIRYCACQKLWNGDPRPCELRWRSGWQGSRDPASGWDGALSVTVHGETTLALGATGQLLHLLTVSGRARASGLPSWVADVRLLFRDATTAVDWEGILRAARVPGLTLPVRTRLRYLRDAWEIPVPVTVLDRLDRLPTTPIDRLYHRLEGGAPPRGVRRSLERALWHWQCHVRGRTSGGPALLTFPAYLWHNRLWAVLGPSRR